MIFLFPSMLPPGSVPPAFMPQARLSKGLDLQGGLHLELAVQTDKAVENSLSRLGEDVDKALKEERAKVRDVETTPKNVKVVVRGEESASTLRSILEEQFKNVTIENEYDDGDKRVFVLTFTKDWEEEIRQYAIDQGIETIRNRVDQFGVAEPVIVPRGNGEILIQLPGLGTLSADDVSTWFEKTMNDEGVAGSVEAAGTEVTVTFPDESSAETVVDEATRRFTGLVKEQQSLQEDGSMKVTFALATSKRAKALIGQTAQLEFRLVDDSVSVSDALANGPPRGSEILYGKKKIDRATGKEIGQPVPYVISKRVMLTGEVVTNALMSVDTNRAEYYVLMEFDSRGKNIFAELTADSVGKRLAIILDGVVQSAPVIREAIPGGRASISGTFTRNEARDLAIALRSGSLPAPVEVMHEIEVGATLGEDSVEAGRLSIIVGFIIVVIFMAFYYKLSGLIADMALLLNVVIVLGALAALGATLTLPGIAGIVLTVGMAVDANVLIFERVREELRLGRSPYSAIEAGYAKAFSTIMDANITTLIAAAVLYSLGTGPIRGFAVTLGIGILSSMFTAIVGTRGVFEYILSKPGVRRLSI